MNVLTDEWTLSAPMDVYTFSEFVCEFLHLFNFRVFLHLIRARFLRLLIKFKQALKLYKYIISQKQTNSLNVHTSIGAEWINLMTV